MLWQWLRSDRYSSAVICRFKKFTTMFLFHWIMGYSINKITSLKYVGVVIKFHQDVYANLKIFLRCAHQKAEVVKFVMCEISGRCWYKADTSRSPYTLICDGGSQPSVPQSNLLTILSHCLIASLFLCISIRLSV